MSVTFTANTLPTVVTIHADEFVADARRAAAATRAAVCRAAGLLEGAERDAARLPDTFRTIGGADAAHILDLIRADLASIRLDAERAAACYALAKDAEDIQGAAEAARDAKDYRSSAEYDADSIARFRDYLHV